MIPVNTAFAAYYVLSQNAPNPHKQLEEDYDHAMLKKNVELEGG